MDKKTPPGTRVLGAVLSAATWLTRPHPRIADAESRQNAQLLSWLMLTTVVVVSSVILFVVSFDPGDLLDTRTLVAISVVIAAAVVYGINRMGYVRVAIAAFLAYLTPVFLLTPYAGEFSEFIPFAVVPMLLAGMFYAFKGTIGFIVTIVLVIFVFNTLQVDEGIWVRRILWYFLLFAGALILAFKYHLGTLESIRRRRLDEVNAQRQQQHLELALEKERGETLRTLMSNISHDIKSPLATINVSLYLLERHADPEKQQEKIDNIKRQVRVLEDYVQDLMAVARLDGAPGLKLTHVDVGALLIAIEAGIRPVIEDKRITFTLDLDEAMPPVLADQADLRSALNNLVQNAIAYTPEGGSVVVRTRKQAGDIVVEVVDTGIGIGEEDLPHIFDRFYRSAPAQSLTSSGSGLGLAIVKRVIEMHGGRVEVETVLGQGSTFRIVLPGQ